MKFTAYYFMKNNDVQKNCIIEAPTRMDAIDLFEELYPTNNLVSLKQIKEVDKLSEITKSDIETLDEIKDFISKKKSTLKSAFATLQCENLITTINGTKSIIDTDIKFSNKYQYFY